MALTTPPQGAENSQQALSQGVQMNSSRWLSLSLEDSHNTTSPTLENFAS